jgi:hypothetical protein
VGAEDYAQRGAYAYGNSSSAILSALVPTAGVTLNILRRLSI